MKLKVITLSALFVAGVCASVALAHDGKRKDGNGCKGVKVSGTIAPQTFTVTLDRARGDLAAGTQLTLTLGAAGQTVRLKAEACSTGTGTTPQLTVKQVELHLERAEVGHETGTTGTTTRTKEHGEHRNGDHKGKDKGQTTTGATTTSATTTTAATTTTG